MITSSSIFLHSLAHRLLVKLNHNEITKCWYKLSCPAWSDLYLAPQISLNMLNSLLFPSVSTEVSGITHFEYSISPTQTPSTDPVYYAQLSQNWVNISFLSKILSDLDKLIILTWQTPNRTERKSMACAHCFFTCRGNQQGTKTWQLHMFPGYFPLTG